MLPGMLGDVLREKRLEAGMTQEDLAHSAHVDRTYVSQLENDRKSPTLDVLFRICSAIGISAAEVVAEVERRQRTRR
jgi:transcriptional regulator with XRE-family HTH domain